MLAACWDWYLDLWSTHWFLASWWTVQCAFFTLLTLLMLATGWWREAVAMLFQLPTLLDLWLKTTEATVKWQKFTQQAGASMEVRRQAVQEKRRGGKKESKKEK